MNLQGLKILSINPGHVFPVTGGKAYKWSFTIVINGSDVEDASLYKSASSSKNAMREEVYRLRRVHGLAS